MCTNGNSLQIFVLQRQSFPNNDISLQIIKMLMLEIKCFPNIRIHSYENADILNCFTGVWRYALFRIKEYPFSWKLDDKVYEELHQLYHRKSPINTDRYQGNCEHELLSAASRKLFSVSLDVDGCLGHFLSATLGVCQKFFTSSLILALVGVCVKYFKWYS